MLERDPEDLDARATLGRVLLAERRDAEVAKAHAELIARARSSGACCAPGGSARVTRSALETPMMRQYLAIKAAHPNAIVFYRMGDFYEMFLRDAELAAPLLDIALTTRDRGKPDAVPMCGVPVHAADAYIQRLAELGHRVAVCEQVEDPARSGGRRLVRREVVEVVTPGLAGDPGGIDAGAGARAGRALPGRRRVRPGGARREHRRPASDRGCAAPGELLPAAIAQELLRLDPRELLCPEPLARRSSAALARLLPEGGARRALRRRSFEPRRRRAFPHGLDAARRRAPPRARPPGCSPSWRRTSRSRCA